MQGKRIEIRGDGRIKTNFFKTSKEERGENANEMLKDVIQRAMG